MVVRNEATLVDDCIAESGKVTRLRPIRQARIWGPSTAWNVDPLQLTLGFHGQDLRPLCTMAPHFDSTKVDLKPRRHHGYAVVLFIFGTLFPPLGRAVSQCRKRSSPLMTSNLPAVAARFGIGKDFWLNLLLTICGYIPGTRLCHVMSETQVA